MSGVFGLAPVVNSGSLRFMVMDGSTVQEPGATETTYRLHIAIDLINLSLRPVEVTTDKIGEDLDHYQLDCGDVVLIDRGYKSTQNADAVSGSGWRDRVALQRSRYELV